MKIYILCDMEGISGIWREKQVIPDNTSDFAEGRTLMMADINAAIDGAFLGGADEVFVCDTHGGGGQLRLEDMDERAIYEMPGGGRMMPSLDESFAGVILLGHHAGPGTMHGFLCHTMSSRSWFEYRLNGQALGEIGIEAAFAGHYDVPVIMVSGDAALEVEARELFGDVECAVVKWAVERNKARCLQPEKARRIIRETAQVAVARAGDFKPFKPSLPAEAELTFCRCDLAEKTVGWRGYQRADGRTVKKTIASMLDIM